MKKHNNAMSVHVQPDDKVQYRGVVQPRMHSPFITLLSFASCLGVDIDAAAGVEGANDSMAPWPTSSFGELGSRALSSASDILTAGMC